MRVFLARSNEVKSTHFVALIERNFSQFSKSLSKIEIKKIYLNTIFLLNILSKTISMFSGALYSSRGTFDRKMGLK